MSSHTSSLVSSILNTPSDNDSSLGDASGPPTIVLDADDISQEMATRLTMALLNQMLYMKGQVSFPVTSLMRMTDRTTMDHASRINEKAFKKKIEFLDAYDDLTCHLRTAFVALSTALAQNDKLYPLNGISSHARPDNSYYCRPPALVHILIVLGPSPSSGKCRFLLELNGLRVEKFGEKAYLARMATEVEDEDEDEDEESGCEESEESRSEDVSDDDPRDYFPLTSQSTQVDQHLRHPTLVRARSSSGSSVPPSSSSSISSSETSDNDKNLSQKSNEQHNVFSEVQRLETELLRAGERLLSRALFTNSDRLDFGDEIGPTQTHILIHAPRRFSHPAWIPRQNLRATLDRHLRALKDFQSLSDLKKPSRSKSAFGTGVRTVGMRVNCRSSPAVEANRHSDIVDLDNEQEELDELIWWSWDGKLVGFTE